MEGSVPGVAAKVSGEGLICGHVICDINCFFWKVYVYTAYLHIYIYICTYSERVRVGQALLCRFTRLCLHPLKLRWIQFRSGEAAVTVAAAA